MHNAIRSHRTTVGLLTGLFAAALLAAGCGDALSPERDGAWAPAFSHGGAHPRVTGAGAIGVGVPAPGSNRQEFDFDVAADLTGRLFYRDWSVVRPTGEAGTLTVDRATDDSTGITSFRETSALCELDPTRGAEFDGVGRLDTGPLLSFTVIVCDNGAALDFFRLDIPSDSYSKSGTVTEGDIVKGAGPPPPPPTGTRVTGLGAIGVGLPTPGSNRQEFDFDVAADLTGRLFYRDWSVVRPTGEAGTITVDRTTDASTGITAFRETSALCELDPTRGAEFDGVGRLDRGPLVSFTVIVCDNGAALDFFRLDVAEFSYSKSGTLTEGDIVKSTS